MANWKCHADGCDDPYAIGATPSWLVQADRPRTQSACHSASAAVREKKLSWSSVRGSTRSRERQIDLFVAVLSALLCHRWTTARNYSGTTKCARVNEAQVTATSRFKGQSKESARDCGSGAHFSGCVLPFLDHSAKIKKCGIQCRDWQGAFPQTEKSLQSHQARAERSRSSLDFHANFARFLRVTPRVACTCRTSRRHRF